MLTDSEVRQIMLEAIAEFGTDQSTVTDDDWRHIASRLRAEMRQRGATDADLEALAHRLIDEFVLVPDATLDAVTQSASAISDGLGFDARVNRERGGHARISLAPKPMH